MGNSRSDVRGWEPNIGHRICSPLLLRRFAVFPRYLDDILAMFIPFWTNVMAVDDLDFV